MLHIIYYDNKFKKGFNMLRVCSKCKRELPLEDFPLDKKGKCGRANQCNECRREYYRQYHKRGKRNVHTYKTHCAKCGCAKHYVLTFHHIDYKTKSFEISGAHRKIEDILQEIKKCVCLCQNCHHTFHYFYGMQPVDPVHDLEEFLKPDWQPNEMLE